MQTHAIPAGTLALLVVLFMGAPLAAQPTDPSEESGPDPEAAYRLAATAGLFGRFQTEADVHEGDFVRFETPAGRPADIRHAGDLLLEYIDVGMGDGVVANQGTTVSIANDSAEFTVHDNRHAWISYRGPANEVTLQFPSGVRPESVSDGLSATIGNHTLRLFYELPQRHNVSMDGAHVQIRPQEGSIHFTITLRSGIYGRDPLPGGWLLVAHTPTGTVVDHVGPRTHDPRIREVENGQMEIIMPPFEPDLRRDRVHLIESVGAFPSTGPLGVSVFDGENATSEHANETHLLTGERAPPFHNLTRSGAITQVLLRQAHGTSGPLFLRYDPEPPEIVSVRFENITRDWAPQDRPPAFRVVSNERIVGTLQVNSSHDEYTFTNHSKALQARFPLDALMPGTHYSWRLVLADTAGNTNETSGAFRTPVDPLELIPQISIQSPREGSDHLPGEPVTVRAIVTDGAGRTLPDDHVEVLHNGRSVSATTWNGTRLIAELGIIEDGPHEVQIIATGRNAAHVTTEEVTFTVGETRDMPGPALGLLVTLTALLVLVRRHTF